MLLKDKFYHIESAQKESGHAKYSISLPADCNVYQGHFPGNPVCPGVCEIETVKELTADLTGSNLAVNHIRRCRFTAVATPNDCPVMEVEINLTAIGNGFTVTATISDGKKQYMDFKGEMQAV